MKKKYFYIAIAILFLIATSEIYLRFYWGFCDTVLMQEEPHYEYIAQPNQNRFRFRNHIKYNEYSMRSEPLEKTDSFRILGFGDSVINGGVLTDHDSLATTIIEKIMTNEYQKKIRCLNISAGSWGPDNCYAYMEKYGDFNANLVFLVASSHDAHDNMTFEKIIDTHPSFPSKQYFSALYELFDRYAIPRLKKETVGNDPIVKGNIFNSGFLSFYRYAQDKNIPFFIYLHPSKQEVQRGQYDEQGHKIMQFCSDYNIPLIQGILYENEHCLRDGIHLNEHGQKVLSEILINEIKKYLDKS